MPMTALRSSESALRRRDEPALIFCPSSIQLIRTVLYNSVLGTEATHHKTFLDRAKRVGSDSNEHRGLSKSWRQYSLALVVALMSAIYSKLQDQ